MIFTSPHAAVDIPDLTLTEYVLQRAHEHGDKPALIDALTGRNITYAQLRPTIEALAAGFASHGVSKDEVFAIHSPNLPEYVVAFHAIASLGAVTTMVSPLFTSEEIKTQLQDSRAQYLLTVPQLLANAREAAQASGITKIFVIGEAEGAIPLSSLLVVGSTAPEIDIAPSTDLAALPYSSGTTGFPKGVMLTHRNLVAMLRQMETSDPFNQDDTLICVVPMYHLYGLHIIANLAMRRGATVVTLPRYDHTEFLKALQDHKVTIAPLVPPLVLALSRSPEVDKYDLSTLRIIHCGAASLSPEVADACAQRLDCQIRYGYGLTEVSPLSHASSGDSHTHANGSVGYCLPNTECKIVDPETGDELGPGMEGEIWVRGPQVMKGYLGNRQATEEMIDRDGWLRTGDLGYADEDGRLFVVDRLKELIKYKGRQVSPAELEAVLLTHPAIADAAIVASRDEEAGEVPKAFVVLKSEATPEDIMSFVADRVAPHKRIRRIEFVESIPKSPAGKILRRVLMKKPD